MKSIRGLALAGITMAMLSAGPSQAVTATGVMPVTAVTLTSCLVAATPMVFGTVNLLTGNANDSTAAITVTCTPGTSYAVGLDQGTHASDGVRYMEGALSTDRLPYVLYSNASRTVAWGNTVGTDTVAGTAGLLASVHTVYGRIPANAPLARAGLYSDAVTVTITF